MVICFGSKSKSGEVETSTLGGEYLYFLFDSSPQFHSLSSNLSLSLFQRLSILRFS